MTQNGDSGIDIGPTLEFGEPTTQDSELFSKWLKLIDVLGDRSSYHLQRK